MTLSQNCIYAPMAGTGQTVSADRAASDAFGTKNSLPDVRALVLRLSSLRLRPATKVSGPDDPQNDTRSSNDFTQLDAHSQFWTNFGAISEDGHARLLTKGIVPPRVFSLVTPAFTLLFWKG
jgi:hypothetical protein